MKKMSYEEIVTLGTTIALNLAKNKDLEEINTIKNLCSQILSTLSTIYFQKIINKNESKK